MACKHTNYLLKRRPVTNCITCWREWDNKQQRIIRDLVEERERHAKIIRDFVGLASPYRPEE